MQEIVTLDKMPYQQQLEEISKLDKQWHFCGAYVDSGGIGSMLAEYANKQVSSRIKPLSFTGANKTPMHEAFRDLVFRQKLLFASKLRDQVIREVQAVSRVVTASGEVRYSAQRDNKGHADGVSSLILALQAKKDFPVNAQAPISFARSTRLPPWHSRLV